MTFLQQTLGKNYKWWYLLQFQFKASTVYRASAVLWTIIKLFSIFGMILIWYVNIQSGSNLYNFKTIFTYFILGSLISKSNGVHWNVSQSITKGTLSKYLICPSSPRIRIIIEDIGWWFFQNSFEVFAILVVTLIGKDYLIFVDFNLAIFATLCGLLGYFVSIFFAFCLGCISFFLTDAHAILDLQYQVDYFTSGKAIPLNVISFLQPLIFLPFAFTFFHPTQIYLGKYSTTEIIYTFGGGIVWCLVLWLLARVIFKQGLKRNEAVGL
jgi:ABC-2 type transport system permease protein